MRNLVEGDDDLDIIEIMTSLSVQLWEWVRSFIGLDGINVEAFNFKDSLNDVLHILHGIWTSKILTVDINASNIDTLSFIINLLVIVLSLFKRQINKLSQYLNPSLTVAVSCNRTLEPPTFYLLLIYNIIFS